MKKIFLLLCSLSMVLFLLVSCKQAINEPNLQDENISLSIGSFDIQGITPSSREILIQWTTATNAVRYDVLVNDTIGLYDVRNNTCLLNYLTPNTDYKISIRAYDKNNFTKSISQNIKTLNESLNEISSLPFGRYEYLRINITHCIVTKDNNYAILGQAVIFDKTYIILIKTDKSFNIIWKINIEGGVFDYGDSEQNIKECNDGSFLIFSKEQLLKISNEGNIVFKKINSESAIKNGIQTSNGNFLFVGYKYMMFNSNSDTLWTKNKEILTSTSDVIQNNAGNYFVYGIYFTNGKYKIAVQELDNSGNKLNEIDYNVSNECYSQFLLDSRDNGFYLISYSAIYLYGYTTEMCVTKIDNIGREIWTLHSSTELNYAVTAKAARVLDDKTLLCLCYESVSQNYYIYEITPNEKIIKSFRAGDMYVPIFVDKDENGRYIILTQGGYIYKLAKER